MADGAPGLVDGWQQGLAEVLENHADLVQELDYHEGARLGRDAAWAAVAPLLWAAHVGDRWDTARVTEFLGITRQAVYKKVRCRSVLGIPGRGTTWFPTWQFDPVARHVRSVVAQVLDVFHTADKHLGPMPIAAWATTEQPELGTTPAAWISAGRDPEQVLVAARHAAAPLTW